MKSYKFYLYMPILVLLLFGVVSCKKSFFSDVNNNPNAPAPSSIVPANLLPTVEVALAYTQGGDYSRYSSLITQQTTGISRQAAAYNSYIFTSQDFDQLWGNFYTSVMENDKTLMQISDSKGYNWYSGISRIIMAYSLQLIVDAWGPVPYSQALKGVDQFHATYDNDKALYDTVLNLASTGIDELSKADPGGQTRGGDEFMYSGDATSWIKFGHAIKARIYIHQSKGDPAMAALALDEASKSLASNSDNAQVEFQSSATSANPWFQFNDQRTDISFNSGYFAQQLIAMNDPRQPILFDKVNDVLLYYGNDNSPVEFIAYDEMQFVQAEATLRTSGNIANAQTFYQAGIRANMEKLGVSSADINTYLAAHGTLPGSVDAAIQQVAYQEYIALYLNPEAWSLWRRTGVPAITPTVGNNIPRRLLYPQSEVSYNGANVPKQVTLYNPKVFWDK